MDYIIVLITTKNNKEAQHIAGHLLNQKLVACVNIIDNVSSNFWWQGKIDTANESLLVCKTQKPLFEKIISETKTHHIYDVPEIIALPIIEGNEDYLKWIKESTSS